MSSERSDPAYLLVLPFVTFSLATTRWTHTRTAQTRLHLRARGWQFSISTYLKPKIWFAVSRTWGWP